MPRAAGLHHDQVAVDMEELTAGLTSATSEALQVEPPPGPRRTASSRSIPRSVHPRITIVIPSRRIPDELQQGIQELAQESVRGNVAVVDQVPKGSGSTFIWVVG